MNKPQLTNTGSNNSVSKEHTVSDNADNLSRRLNNRQIQLVAIGGSIGTALFISIGNGLAAGGPASLFIAYGTYSLAMACVNNCIAEMIVLYPVSGGFVRLAGKFVDDAFGFMAGWNFFLYEALLIPFEITALNLILGYWRDDIPVAAVCAAVTAAYGFINFFSVRAYGEAEFWLSSGKVILIFILFMFTFITMVGGNPQHHAFGFHYWNDPGPFAEHPLRVSNGNLGRFEGFLATLWSAAFCIVGPEYIAMAAAETKRPREYIKTAYKVMYLRFGLFFVLGALCVGILVPWNDPTLQAVLSGVAGVQGSAAASPYVIAMKNMGVSVLPHIVNALIFTCVFSAGNAYTYCATRTLYSLALDGRAPRILTKCTNNGIPWLSLGVVMLFPFLSFLSLSHSASKVIVWLVNVITAGALIDFIVMCITYLMFYRACKVQGLDRATFSYTAAFQPYCAWIGLAVTTTICLSYGYTSFFPWSIASFFQNYTMQIFAILLFCGWKFTKKTHWLKPHELDLIWERPLLDAYEANFIGPPVGFWTEVLQLIGLQKHKRDDIREIEHGSMDSTDSSDERMATQS